MFNMDEILNMSTEQFNKLSPDERKFVLEILKEFEKYGKSPTLEQIWYTDYDEIPVSVTEFITNPYYLGKSTRNGESIYPYWRKKYVDIFDESKAYQEIVLTGAIGVGKTRTAVVCLAYLMYKLMCLRNPQEFFKFNEGDKITIFFLNINLKLAEGVGYKTLHEYLLRSPWFMERGTQTGRTNLLYNPPNNIGITFGSKSDHALGQQVFAGFLDEVDFTKGGIKGGDALNMQNGIMQSYNTVKQRINSRFIKNGVNYGRLFLVSSKKSEHDFLEAYVRKMKAEGQDKHMLIVDEPQWVIKPEGTFSKETFTVAVGNKSLKSRVLKTEPDEEEEKSLIKQGYEILKVPVTLKQDFLLDVNRALMDLAGRSVVGATSFFNYDMFSKCYISDYHNPFTTDIITAGMHDDINITDFFSIDDIPPAVRLMPQFIHIDGSLTGDKTGISSVGVSGRKEIIQYAGAQEIPTEELVYKHIFSVDIQAPQGDEISLEKTRKFIYYLRGAGFNIRGISVDGYQSADTKQILTTQGFNVDLVSLDKTPQGYLSLRSAMNDGRIGLIQIDLLETELVQLQRDVTTGKIDHPVDGCFTGDTLIRLEDGTSKQIIDLVRHNDKCCYGYDLKNHRQVKTKIKKVFHTKYVNELTKITLDNNKSIRCTPDHLFLLQDETYVKACELSCDSKLMSTEPLSITNVETYKFGEPIPVFDMEVPETHNFLLDVGIYVHNSKDMADSLAGALWNATLHKNDLIDGLDLLSTAVDVNEDVDPRESFISDMQQAMLSNSFTAQNKLSELMSNFGDSDIIGW